MRFKTGYWTFALFCSFVLGVVEKESFLSTWFMSWSDNYVPDKPATLHITLHFPFNESQFRVEGLTMKSASRLQILIHLAVIGMFCSLNMTAYYFIWLIAYRKRHPLCSPNVTPHDLDLNDT